jgi:hypothetical protein
VAAIDGRDLLRSSVPAALFAIEQAVVNPGDPVNLAQQLRLAARAIFPSSRNQME